MQHDFPTLYRNLRVALGLSQSKFALLVGATRDKIAAYEMGRSKPPADILMNTLELIRGNKKQRNRCKSNTN